MAKLYLPLAAALCLVLAGCPASQKTGDAPVDPGESASPAPAGAAPAAEPASPADTAAGNSSVPPNPYQLEIDGFMLGRSYSETDAYIHQSSSPRVSGIWEDKTGQNGAVMVRPASGAALPADDYLIVDGTCIGYFKRFKLGFKDFAKVATFYANNFEPGKETPPAWAADDPFLKSLPQLAARDVRVFWHDEGRGELLILQYQDAPGNAFFALYRPRLAARLGLDYPDLAAPFEAAAAEKNQAG